MKAMIDSDKKLLSNNFDEQQNKLKLLSWCDWDKIWYKQKHTFTLTLTPNAYR